MAFTEKAKLIAMAIVHIFETSRPFGEYDAYVVLDDGAGVSYGLSQFTHRSGSLLAVIKRYLELEGSAERDLFERSLDILHQNSRAAINELARSKSFKSALIAAAKTPEMQRAQREIAQSKYFGKAVKACEGSNFVLPMSLAVVYDSINHGSYDLIRDRVSKRRKSFSTDIEFEKAWITEYVNDRDDWLESVPRLRKTDYRTDFFLAQIARNNWNLNLPLNVHGFKLTEKHFISEVTADNVSDQIDSLSTAAPVAAESEAVEAKNDALQQAVGTPNDAIKADSALNSEPEKQTTEVVVKDGNVSVKTSDADAGASAFTPQVFQQYIPKITKAKRWLGGLSFLGFFSSIGAKLAGMPDWLVFLLGFLTGIAFSGLVALFIVYHKQLFNLVQTVVKINADPLQNNIQLVDTKV